MATLQPSLPAPARPPRPHAADILRLPRYAGSATTRWVAGALFVLLAGGGLALGDVIPGAKGEQVGLLFYCLGVGFMWWMWLSGLLLLARDGRRLGVPGVARASALVTLAYAVAMAAAPGLLVIATHGDVAEAFLYPALAVAASLAWMLLPRWVAMWFGFLPAIYIGLHNGFGAPSPFDPRLRPWAWFALVALVAADVMRWRRLLASEDNDDSRWSGAMLLQVRRNVINRDWWSIDRNWAWRGRRHRRLHTDFHGIDRGHSERTIRVMLGGWYLPQTWRNRAISLSRALLPMLLFVPLLLFMNLRHTRTPLQIWHVIGVGGGLWVGAFGSLMLAGGVGSLVARRWGEHANLALLALLPGMDATASARNVAGAALRGPTVSFIALWLCLLLGTGLTVPTAPTLLLATAFELTLGALMAMAVLRTIAGQSTGLLAKVLLGIGLLVLADASFTLDLVGRGHRGPGFPIGALLVLAWLAMIAWPAWQAARAWRALQRRPHPFLPSGAQ
ncbi:MAG TPA: hypothetical protein VFQ95_06630 [Rhodanobacteraceae bacterium]|nr:hypothetical protein [Rhodanobacteraceae bacterium]